MYLFELFNDNTTAQDAPPLLPVFGSDATPPMQTLDKLGLDGDGVLSWAAVCSTIIGQPAALYREVRGLIAVAPNPQLSTKYAIDALVNRNYYKYKAMRDIIGAEYDPLANYDMTEHTTVNYTGGQTTNNTQTTDSIDTHTESAATDSTTYGGTTSTTAVDEVTDSTDTPQTLVTTQRGAAKTTETTAAATTTETNERDVYGYDAPATGQHDTKDTRTLTAPEQTTTQSADAVTDTVSTDAVTVTSHLGARNATVTDNEHTDTINRGERSTRDTHNAGDTSTTTEYNNRVDTTEINRTGNIGVTTSQQLLMSELELRRATEYINVLATDILNALTIGVYGLGGM